MDEALTPLLDRCPWLGEDAPVTPPPKVGAARSLAPLTHVLAETLPQWRREAGPAAERIAKSFAAATRLEVPTPLTQSNRSRGRGKTQERAAATRRSRLSRSCRGCGEELGSSQNIYCRTCDGERDRVEAFRMSGVKKLAELRASGYDPTATTQARSKIGATNRAQSERRAEWERTHEERPDPSTFRAEVLPKIQEVPLRRLAEVTGLSITHCAKIRAGLVVPHAMHWEAFANL